MWCKIMSKEVTKDPLKDFSLKDLEDRFERDLKRFKKNVDRAFSEQHD